MDFGTLAFSFSVTDDADGGGVTSTSASEVEDWMRAVCEAVRRREVTFGGNTWTGYGDS
jgi:hypothetical protein